MLLATFIYLFCYRYIVDVVKIIAFKKWQEKNLIILSLVGNFCCKVDCKY